MGDGGGDAYAELDRFTAFRRQYEEMIEILAMIDGLFTALAAAMERVGGLFLWADERISGTLLITALAGAVAPFALPLFYQVVAGVILLVAMAPPAGPAPAVDFPGRLANVVARIPTRSERVL